MLPLKCFILITAFQDTFLSFYRLSVNLESRLVKLFFYVQALVGALFKGLLRPQKWKTFNHNTALPVLTTGTTQICFRYMCVCVAIVCQIRKSIKLYWGTDSPQALGKYIYSRSATHEAWEYQTECHCGLIKKKVLVWALLSDSVNSGQNELKCSFFIPRQQSALHRF